MSCSSSGVSFVFLAGEYLTVCLSYLLHLGYQVLGDLPLHQVYQRVFSYVGGGFEEALVHTLIDDLSDCGLRQGTVFYLLLVLLRGLFPLNENGFNTILIRLWSDTWSIGSATMALRMAMFLVHIWSNWLPSLWVTVPYLSAGLNPATTSFLCILEN